jgi:mannose-1-phosphate guanylyltransferase
MASLHSDHAVRDADDFRAALAAAFEVARAEDWLVTLGIRPSSPHTGMGYIEGGETIGSFGGREAQRVARFVEKPDRATAEKFVASGYLWNAGYFIWRIDVIQRAFAKLLPDMQEHLTAIGAAMGGPKADDTLQTEYPKLRVETIDYGIMERADRIATIPADFGWNDIGGWSELWDISDKDESGNSAHGDYRGIDSARNLIWAGDRPVFTLGVEDLVIVDTPDALLVVPRERAEQLKLLIEQLQSDPNRRGLL